MPNLKNQLKKRGRPKKEAGFSEKSNNNHLNLAVDSEKIEDIKEDYQNAVLEEKPKRKTKKIIEAEEIEKQKSENFASACTLTASIGLELVFSKVTPNNPLSEAEKENFNASFNALIQKYYSSINRFGEELNFAIALSFIVIPRYKDFKKNKNESKTNFRENRYRENIISKESDFKS